MYINVVFRNLKRGKAAKYIFKRSKFSIFFTLNVSTNFFSPPWGAGARPPPVNTPLMYVVSLCYRVELVGTVRVSHARYIRSPCADPLHCVRSSGRRRDAVQLPVLAVCEPTSDCQGG